MSFTLVDIFNEGRIPSKGRIPSNRLSDIVYLTHCIRGSDLYVKGQD